MQQHKIEREQRVGRSWDSAVAIFRRLHIRAKP